jgi:hypothetical protein
MIPAKPAANAIQLRNGLQRFYFRFLAAAAMVVVSAPAVPTFGQLGSAWVSTSYTKKIHLDDDIGLQTFNWTSYKSVCSPVCADYSYDSSTDTETFRLLDGRTNRSEIRLQNEYSAGMRQFEGYVTFYSPLNDESLFQIFGSTDGATLCMMRGYSSNGGKIHVVGGIGDIQLNTYGVERRINVIHNQNKYVQFYVDSVFKGEFSENEQVENYWKYGDYGTVASDTVPAVVKWRAVRTFRDGLPPGGTATPPGAYEAEDAVLNGAVTAASQSGFTGAGFADFLNPSGDNVNWTVNAQNAGRYDLKFRYALQTSNRPLEIQVNGQVVNAALSFPATGNWVSWQYVTLPSQQLLAGTNTIGLTATGSSGPNIDHLLMTVAPTGFGDYNQDGVVNAADYIVWRRSRGQQVAHGTGADGNANGTVDDSDYDIWRFHFGTTLPTGAGNTILAAAVPEPNIQLSIAIIGFAHAARARRSSRHCVPSISFGCRCRN